MADYITVDDVQKRMPQFQLTATTKPSLDDAPAFIADAESEFNLTVGGLGFVTPITAVASPNSFQIAVAMVSRLTIALILEARAAAVGGEAAMKSAEQSRKYYDDRITWLDDPDHPFDLEDAITNGDNVSKPADILAVIEIPEPTAGESWASENWPSSRPARITEVH